MTTFQAQADKAVGLIEDFKNQLNASQAQLALIEASGLLAENEATREIQRRILKTIEKVEEQLGG